MTDEEYGRAWARQQNHHPIGFPEFVPDQGPFWKTPPLRGPGGLAVFIPDASSEADAYAALGRAVRTVHAAVPPVTRDCGNPAARDLDGEWTYVPIPVDRDGVGPVDPPAAVRTEYQVWDCAYLTVAVCDSEAAARRIVGDHNAILRCPAERG